MYYQPRFLQGGTHFEIRYETSHVDLTRELEMHKSKALAVYDGSPGLFYYINKQHGYPTAEFRDEDNKTESPLPSDFKVLVLDSKSRSEETWNHDYSRGIAISLKRNEVIYWAGAW